MSQGSTPAPTATDSLPMSNEHQDTPRDVEPLNVYLGAYLRKWMGKPPSWEAEKIIGQILKHQLMGLFRAAFITGALALLAFAGQEQLKPFYHWLGDKWAVGKSYWALATCVGLLVASMLLPRIAAACQRLRRWAENRRYLPFWTLIPVVGLLVSGFYQSPFWGTVYGLALLSLLFVQLKAPIVSRHDPKDSFQRSYFVERLMEHFLRPETRLRRIGVFGTWGSGKTTVLKLLREALAASPSKKFRVAWVNPWTAKTPEEALALIAQGFDEALGSSPLSFLSWSWLGAIKASFDGGLSLDLHRLINGGATDTEAKLIDRINGRMKAMKINVVLLVDDMERAECEVIRRIFPLIDRLGAIKQGFFVFAVDPDRVAKAFKENSSGEEETKGYLDKVFDLQITLPDLRPKDIEAWGKERISPQETPKLYAAWDELKDVLPTNPREALHFINDAVMKEVLFLSRLANDEPKHDFAGFFLFQMLKLELPEFLYSIGSDIVDEYRISKTASDMNLDSRGFEDPKQILDRLWNDIQKVGDVSNPKYFRLKKIFEKIFNSSVDFKWATHHYMRLIALTDSQKEALLERWKQNCGQESLETSIQIVMPKISSLDRDVTCIELIQDTVAKYERSRRGIHFKSSPQELEKINNLTASLRCLYNQLIYGYERPSPFDVECFSPDLFHRWLEVLNNNDIDGFHDWQDSSFVEAKNKWLSLEYSFLTLLSDRLSLKTRFEFSRRSAEEINNDISFHRSSNLHLRHLKSLKFFMQSKVRDELLDHLQKGGNWKEELCLQLSVFDLAVIFGDPTHWLPDDSSDILASFSSRAIKSCNFAESMAEIVNSFLYWLMKELRTETVHIKLISTVKSRPAYYLAFWKAAHASQYGIDKIKPWTGAVKKLIDDTPSPALTLVEFEAAFPFMAPVSY
ncbi:hypothetical protein GCM10023213_48740 [Prosthecobacter algae]|uniref:KAP NTPase domain-containing protein n=1 Tax=Prosthecobacter algae TaxID=1144682 RepID=A0ABP9PPY2_9BACT